MDHVRMVSVPEEGLRTVLDVLAPVIKGRELGRMSYHEHREVGSRFTGARTTQDKLLLSWWRQTCAILGVDADLTGW